jgi:fluoroquinolone transport system permease protein
VRESALAALVRVDSRLLWRDPLLGWVLLLPIGLAMVLRLLLPQIAEALLAATRFDLEPFFPLVMGGYLMTAPGIVGMVVGFLFLDERDARTLMALRVTPFSTRRYLAYRTALPLVVGTAATLIGYRLTGIRPLPLGTLSALAIVAGLSAPLLAFVLAAAAPNKVAGFAVVKVLNGLNLLPVAAYFVPVPMQYVAGVFPTYWPMRALWSAAAGEEYAGPLAIGAIWGSIAVTLAALALDRRLMRNG